MALAAVLRILVPAMWAIWAVVWLAAGLDTKPTRWRESTGSRALHLIPLLACILLLVNPHWLPQSLSARFRPPGTLPPLLGTALVAAGLAFVLWARAHLGRNWSGIVTLKQDHALVRSGPYRTIRHPIYTGLLFAIIGTAVAIGEWRGVLAVGCALVAILWKIRVEERHMQEAFPEYAEYRARTAALVPLLY